MLNLVPKSLLDILYFLILTSMVSTLSKEDILMDPKTIWGGEKLLLLCMVLHSRGPDETVVVAVDLFYYRNFLNFMMRGGC